MSRGSVHHDDDARDRRYLHERWNVDELDFTQDHEDWAGMPADAHQTFLCPATR
jgi:hypothetical protein